MVFYFESTVVDPSAVIYIGKDKFENEDLIKYGYEQDIWFHVDKYSSAHLYLRLQPGQDWKKLDPKLLQDCAQLVKANSIEGNKKDNIYVIYTPWSNLRKAKDMEVGTIGFKSEKNVKRIFVDKRDNAIVKRLEKTKVEKVVDHAKEAQDRSRQKDHQQRAVEKQSKEEEARLRKQYKEQEDLKQYKSVMKAENMQSNLEVMATYTNEHGEVDIHAYEDDFM